jgi:hypothetical protein
MALRSATTSVRSLSVISRILLLAVLLLAPARAFSQCAQTGTVAGVATSNIANCQLAVSPQPTDLLFSWQNDQSPHTRRMTLGQAGQSQQATAAARLSF